MEILSDYEELSDLKTFISSFLNVINAQPDELKKYKNIIKQYINEANKDENII